MFRRIIILLLTITCYYSLGSPLSTNLPVYSLEILLNSLVKRCENDFLVPLIKDKISECNLTVPPFKSEQMQCLIFYDMSKQLCDAIDSPKPLPLENLQKVDKIDVMCNEIAITWKFSNLTDIPSYKTIAENVFNKAERCKKVCEVSDLDSDDTNSFCNYFKWGSQILKIQASTSRVEHKTTNNKVMDTLPVEIVNTNAKTKGLDSVNNTVSTTKNIGINTNNTYNNKLRELNSSEILTTTNGHDNEVTEHEKYKIPNSSRVEVSGVVLPQPIRRIEINSPKQTENETPNNIQESVAAQKSNLSDNPDNAKILLEEEVPPKKDDIEKEDQLLRNQNDLVKEDKDAIIDDIEDDADSEEDDKQDLQDDSEISIGKADLPKIEEQNKENIKSNIPLITSYTAEKSQDFISKMPQDDFPEGDDHFISFFLTAVIVVILLYILYHNKNKFTKVVLGLLVEGRQHGRRRNSRGHAYRRLDTLEQAMSTNSPAPPSKIIY